MASADRETAAMRTGLLPLSSLAPLATGHLRLVYAHPEHPQRLIKVMREEMVAARWGGAARWYKRLPRALHYTGFVRELKEYIAIHARHANADPPIARVHGIVETDRGLGLVVDRVVAADGALAPTLETLVREQSLAPWIVSGVDQLFDQLRRYNVIIGDVHPGNIVYGTDGRGGAPRFLLIDGFGEKNVFPRCSMSRAINQHNTQRRYLRLQRKLQRLLAPAVKQT